ncbi:FkbM family methyltransferase [Ferruginibacter paludis]|uniref:FkbM family methyltransferase n=1 Tax=Ferruginibacter paludis TaxID=1310417 RepID=UPI0025B34783|nr:FkbM family methyltransferase [Ferruginibacter paludis]MDN3655856.1 FkbM family methyltransferase [Ferruginibacter paludis]
MSRTLLNQFRQLPWFRGKLRIGQYFFNDYIHQPDPVSFTAHYDLLYNLPNTVESLGIVLLISGVYQKKEVEFLIKHIEEGSFYFDIGANIGALGLPVVKQKPGIKYIGFEASPLTYSYLEKNFSENKITNYELHNFVVYDNDMHPMRFYQSEHYGKSSLAPTYTKKSILVNSISLDSFCSAKQIQHISWIKIDVQGFELFVFKGMHGLLQNKQVDNILFEFEYWAEADAGLEKGAAQDYIKAMGYSLFTMDGVALTETIREGRAMIWGKPSGKNEKLF